ncbi:MAG: PIN domain-containing protein [Microscillaceae bacterium]|jgi:predicted nucleic acid-binding protein|nr:PIN domain-containing protein [Microscillaceae bacterium]
MGLIKLSDLNARKIGLDTAPLIYFMEANPAFQVILSDFFDRHSKGEFYLTASVLVLTEVLILPLRTQNMTVAQQYRDILMNTTGLSLINLNPAIAEKTAQLRAKYNLRTPDAIHLATSINENCDYFLSNHFQLKQITEIEVITINELIIV